MTPVFESKRLRIFQWLIEPTAANTPRRLFVAFRTDEDRPMVCATAVVGWMGDGLRWWVDWIEVTSEYRREGFATELLLAIEERLGERTTIDAGSEDGEQFCTAIYRARHAKGGGE